MFGLSDYPDAILRGTFLAVVALLWVIAIVRIVGLRTFSKMTAFDFVITLATGSLLASASTVSTWPAFVQALVAVLALLTMQVVLARLRRHSRRIQLLLENDPVLLVHDGKILYNALKKTRVSKSDLVYKLREANVKSFADVRAIVLESTGDISILSGHTAPSNEVMNEVDQKFSSVDEHRTRQNEL